MNFLLIPAAIALFVLQSVSLKLMRTNRLCDKLLTTGAFALLAGVCMMLAGLIAPSLRAVSLPTLLWGLAFGVLFALAILFYNLAIDAGPFSYTAFYFSASMLVPTLAGVFFFHEKAGPSLVGAIALFLAAFFFLNVGPGHTKARPSKKWVLYCVLTFFTNGALAVVQRCHQTALRSSESGGLMLVGFLTASLFCLIGYFPARGRSREEPTPAALLRKNRVSICLLAAGSLGGNLLLTHLAGIMPSSYLYPLAQGGVIVGVALVSALAFRERLSWRGKAGLALGVCAIVLINL